MAARNGAVAVVNGASTGVEPLADCVELRTASWGDVNNDRPLWKQDVVSCSHAEWERIRGQEIYSGWHVCSFVPSVVAISPVYS